MAAILPLYHLPLIEERIAKINKRASKLGVDGVTLVVSEPFEHTFYRSSFAGGEREVKEPAVEVHVEGAEIRYDGWSFVATIDHRESLIRSAPHAPEDIDLQKYVSEPNCDHCRLDRRRNATFIAQHEDGRVFQVGRSCLKDFLGHPVSLYVADAVWGADEELFGSLDDGRVSLIETLALVNAVIRTYGWVPKSRETMTEVSTASLVSPAVFGPGIPRTNGVPEYTVEDADFEVAQAAYEWALEVPTSNDYLFNLRQIATNGFVTYRSLGLAASMISAYRKDAEKQETRKRGEAEASPVPSTTDRIEIQGAVVNVTFREGYGYNAAAVKKITVLDDRGFKVWGTCPSKIYSAEVGDRVAFTATIEAGDRDPSFGFFRRPTKPIMLTEEVSA